MCKSQSFLKFQVLPERRSVNFLILVLLFLFVIIDPTCMCKSHISLKFQVLREGSSVIVSFVEHPVYSIFKMYSVPILVFLFWFTTVNPKCCVKVTLWKCQVLHKGSSDIASFVEHPVNSIFKRYSVLTLAFLFWFPILTQIACVKFSFSWNFRCSAKEAVLLLLSWSTLHVVILKCIISWFATINPVYV